MTRTLIVFLFFVFFISCKENKANTKIISKVNSPEIDTPTIKEQNLPVDSIRFDIVVRKKASKDNSIKINASFFNMYKDTVYFLTWGCDGLIYDFIYDTAKLGLSPHYLCNASSPVIEDTSKC